MAGEMGDEVPESEVTRGRTISREEPPTTATSAKDELDVRASSDQGSGQPPANGEQQRSGSRASTSSAPRGDSSNTAKPSRVSWAALAGKGITGAKLDMRSVASPSRDDLPIPATPVSAIQDVSSGRPAGEAGLPVSRGLDEGLLSNSASGSSSVSRRNGSVSRGRRRNPGVSRGTIPVQQARQPSRPKSPAPTTSESTPLTKQEGEETQSSNPAPTAELIESTESKGLEDVRNYLRGLAESHGILHLVNKEPAPITCEQLLKNFASKVSEECSTWQEKLQIESSKLEASTQAHAQLEGEKTALQQIVATQTDKLGELGPLEQKARDLKVQFTKCINERDKLKSSLEANQNQLKTAQNECNEKEIALQYRTAELNEVQLRIQQMAPPVNEEELKSTISKLRDQLNAEMSARATAERKLEEEKGVWQAKEKRHEEDVSYMEKQLVDHQKQVKEALATVESLRKQLTEQTRKVSQAQIEVENMTFTVDHENVPLAEYRKLVDNARGEVSDLEVRLAQAETERDEALKQDVPMDGMRDIIGEVVGFYGLAMDDAANNLYSNWREGEARLADLVCDGNDGFRRYPHAVVLSDEKPSQSLSDDLFSPPKRTSGAVASKCEESQTESEPEERLNLAKELGEFNSQSSAEPEENQGSPDRTLQTIEDELSRLDRISSAVSSSSSILEAILTSTQGSQGSKVGQGDVSLELRNTKVALDECQNHRKEADKKIKDLKDEAKKLVDEIVELKASARVLEQTIEEHESNAERTKGEANRPSAIQARDEQDFETNRKEADEKIKNLEVLLQQRTKELKRSQRREEFMSQVSEQLKGQLSAVHDRLGKAEAKAMYACAREKLAQEKMAQEAATADGSSTGASSLDDPGEHLQLVADLIDRVDKAESEQAASRRDLQEIQQMVAGLHEDAKNLREERNGLALEKDQLQEEKVELSQQRDALKEDLKTYMDSADEVAEQNVRLLEQLREIEQEMRKKIEEIKRKDEEIQHKDGEIRENDLLLREKMEELEAKQKALDECHEHGERLNAEVRTVEEKVVEFRNKWSFANQRYDSELKRRLIVEQEGVDHLENMIKGKLVEKDKELREEWMAEHKKTVERLENEIRPLKRRAEVGETELERTKATHQEVVDGLESKIRDLESRNSAAGEGANPTEIEAQQNTIEELKLRVQHLESRNQAPDEDADLAKIKDEHQKTVDALELKIQNLEEDHRRESAGLERQVLSLTSENEGLTRVLSGTAVPSGIMISHQGTQTHYAPPVESSTRNPDHQPPIEGTLGTTSGTQDPPPEFRAMHQQFQDAFKSLIRKQSATADKLDSFFKRLCDTLGKMELPENPDEYEVDRLVELRDAFNEARTKMYELGLQKRHFFETNIENYPDELYEFAQKIHMYKERLERIEVRAATTAANTIANATANENSGGNNAGGSDGDSQPHQSEAGDWVTASSSETPSGGDDDDFDIDGPDPGDDPKKLRKAIVALERMRDEADATLAQEGRILRRNIAHYGGIFNRLYQDLGNPREPARQLQQERRAVGQAVRDLAGSEATVAGPSSAAGTQPNVAEPPLPPDPSLNRSSEDLDKWRGKKKAYRFPDDGDPGSSGDSTVDGDIDQYGSPKRTPWEARVYAIREILTQTYREQRACMYARNAIMEATLNLQVADDPVRNQPGPTPSGVSAHPLPSAPADQGGPGSSQAGPSSTAAQPASPDSQNDESRRAFQSHNAFDDLVTEISSQASSDFFNFPTTDRILPSYLPRSIWDPLNDWSMSCENVQSNLERLNYAIEGLIHDGINSQNYEFLRSRARQLKIMLEKANATITALKAREVNEFVGRSDNELAEEAQRLKKENKSLEEKLEDFKQIAVKRQNDERLKRFAADARASTLENMNEKLKETISKLEKDKKQAIDDGVDKEIRETVYYYEEQKKETEKLKREIAKLEKKLAEEQSTKSAVFDGTVETIKDLQEEIRQLRRANEKLVDRGRTLATDMERALDVTAGKSGTDAQKLARMRQRITNALHLDVPDYQEIEDFPLEAESEREQEFVDAMKEYERQSKNLRDLNDRQVRQQKRDFDDRLAKRDASMKLQQSKLREILASQRQRLRLCETELEAERMQLQHAKKRMALMEKQLQEQARVNVDLMIDQDENNLKATEEGTSGEEPEEDKKDKGKQRAGAPGGPDGDPDDGDDDDDNHGEGSSGGPRGPGKKRTGSGRMCGCPCLGACDSAGRPIAARQEVIHDLVTFYAKYRRCCGRKANMRSAASQTTAESASGTETAEVPEDDGLLLVRLAGLLHMDSDTRNRIENPRLSYLARLLLAFWSCIRIHGVAWKQTLYWLVAGSLYSAVYYLPGRRWRPGPPTTPSPKLVALAIKDAITLYWFYYLYQALMATWAVQRVYDMANGYTRAYYVERALHPERSRWWGLDGIDMRLSGFSTTEPPAPITTDDGAAGIRRGL
ncbi:hypothetical protein CABS01_03270 [Colletotrichum abscissum]|uniref:Uncharacterized protein n=1 Tax=Colletotrichum abscissum TaxID=1671311 RepID=A0A9P9XBZ8_9PEZI|nr:uncharacterized protein CABS01_03270 [Colletotrichum abscissum]KAI3546200.1 hypothetical protein CABS02_09077 [Colletotrichum abscissum]KAK1477968.1 hypothetical protein CABS01_03270 [Colletotrichum abscissum]